MTNHAEHALRDAGLRVTAGRLALIAAIDAAPHSDAVALYRIMQDYETRTSLPSVHNMLADLTAAGIVRRIEPADSPARYERRIGDNHHHVVCTSCGAVADVDCVVGHAPCLSPSDVSGFAVATAEVTFWGLCASCQAAPTPTT